MVNGVKRIVRGGRGRRSVGARRIENVVFRSHVTRENGVKCIVDMGREWGSVLSLRAGESNQTKSKGNQKRNRDDNPFLVGGTGVQGCHWAAGSRPADHIPRRWRLAVKLVMRKRNFCV